MAWWENGARQCGYFAACWLPGEMGQPDEIAKVSPLRTTIGKAPFEEIIHTPQHTLRYPLRH